MSNFIEFIEEDVEAKKTLVASMPTKTKADKLNYNKKIETTEKIYNEYKIAVKKYLDAKSKSFNIKPGAKKTEELIKELEEYKKASDLLSPYNTYLEKLGFDTLLYKITNCYDFNFESLIEIINEFLDKFEEANIKITNADFNYTYCVNDYMEAFFTKDRKIIESEFERIYWINPEIVEHIEINFKRLIRKNSDKLKSYTNKLQEEVKKEKNIIDYKDCLKKILKIYSELKREEMEKIGDIINLAKTGETDINNYFEDSKIRINTYEELLTDIDRKKDPHFMAKFYVSLEKLLINIEEYEKYTSFIPIFEYFKKEYEKQVSNAEVISNENLKKALEEIVKKESELDKINKKIIKKKSSKFTKELIAKFKEEKLAPDEGIFQDSKKVRQLKLESLDKAKELYDLYQKYDEEYIKDKIFSLFNKSVTVPEVLSLYCCFDYFKKKIIKEVFKLEKYEDIIEKGKEFDEFANNPSNMIINGISLFEDTNVPKIIINRYRLDNVKLSEEDLEESNLEVLLEKIKFLLRINVIENSKTDVDKIWFMVQVEKINQKEKK